MYGRKLWLLIYLQHKTTFPTNMAVKLWNPMFFMHYFNTLSKIWQFLAFSSQKTTWSADISHNLLIDGFSQSYSYTDKIFVSELWLSSLMLHSQKIHERLHQSIRITTLVWKLSVNMKRDLYVTQYFLWMNSFAQFHLHLKLKIIIFST